jgi:hypothetical protein
MRPRGAKTIGRRISHEIMIDNTPPTHLIQPLGKRCKTDRHCQHISLFVLYIRCSDIPSLVTLSDTPERGSDFQFPLLTVLGESSTGPFFLKKTQRHSCRYSKRDAVMSVQRLTS